ncbi:MAG: rod shape-determining protein MreC [candidate division WOR-3 bacterium]
MKDYHRFLLAIFVAGIFLLPFPRKLVHNTLLATLYVPALRAEALVLDILHVRSERDYLLEENARLAQQLGEKALPFGERRGMGTARPLRFDPPGIPERIIVDAGKNRGIEPGDVLMSGGALAGRVSVVESNTSSVITPFSPDFMAGVVDTRSLVGGVLVGGASPVVEYIPSWEDVRAGDTLITSGLAGFLPPGVPVAVVENVYRTEKPFLEVTAKPLYQPQKLRNFTIVHGDRR